MDPYSGLTTLTRLAGRRPHASSLLEDALRGRMETLAPVAIDVAQDTGDPIGRILATQLESTPSPELASRLHDQIPSDTVALREAAVIVTKQMLSTEKIGTGFLSNRGIRLFANLAERLRKLGRLEEARQAAETAKAGFLAARDQSPEIQAALLNLGPVLSELGNYAEAARVSRLAVDHFRKQIVGGDGAERFFPDLATALHNLAGSLSDLGNNDEGLAAIEESVALRRHLGETSTYEHTKQLGHSLIVKCAIVSELGDNEEALRAAEEAVNIYREVYEIRPDACRPELAAALTNLSGVLYDLTRFEEAYSAIEEAVALRTQLARARPDAFNADLLSSLNTMAAILSEATDPTRLAPVITEAIELARALSVTFPDRFRESLARTMSQMARAEAMRGDYEAAIRFAREGVDIYRELSRTRPDVLRPTLAKSLNNLSVFLSDEGRDQEALACAEEAVAIYDDLASSKPELYEPTLAVALNTLAGRYNGMGQLDQAFDLNHKALGTLLPHAETHMNPYHALWLGFMLADHDRLSQKLGGRLDDPVVVGVRAIVRDTQPEGE